MRALFEQAGRLLIQRIAPLADEIHDSEGNRQDAEESYEEFEEIPVEGVDHDRDSIPKIQMFIAIPCYLRLCAVI